MTLKRLIPPVGHVRHELRNALPSQDFVLLASGITLLVIPRFRSVLHCSSCLGQRVPSAFSRMSVFAGTDIVRLQLASNSQYSHECCQYWCAVTFRVVVRSMQYRLVAKCTEVVAGIEESPEGHYTNKT